MQSHLLMVAEEPLVALSVGNAGGQDIGLNIGGPAEMPCWHIAWHRSTLYLVTHLSKSTAKGSQNTSTHNEESYLKWGFQAQSWTHCLAPASLGVGEPEEQGGFTESKKLFWVLEVEGLHCLNGYETSGTCPIYFLLPAPTSSGFLYFSVQIMFGLWLLMSQHYNLVLMALLPLCKPFCWCLLQKTEVLILVSCLHIGIAAFWGQLHFLLSSKFNEIIFHVTQELYWFAVQLFAGLYQLVSLQTLIFKAEAKV